MVFSNVAPPLLFREDATIHEDRVVGAVVYLLSLALVILSTMGLAIIIKYLLDGLSVRVVHAVTRCNGYFGIFVGGAVTVFVQSSQVVISTIVPFAGVGALPLETVYPMVVGSNIGTAIQTVMTSMSAFGVNPLRVALAHLFFNVTGGLLWYPLPHLRAVILWLARRMGESAKLTRLFPAISIVGIYLVLPLFVFGMTKLYLTNNVGAQVAVVVIGASCASLLLYLLYWCRYQGGYQTYVDHVSSKQSKDSIETMAETDAVHDIEEDARKNLETTANDNNVRKNLETTANDKKSSRRSRYQSESIHI
jgi:solute carrier family 34 (sodium-dependent phosphate cotransporter)